LGGHFFCSTFAQGWSGNLPETTGWIAALQEQLQNLLRNIAAMGVQRLLLLGGTLAVALCLLAAAAFYLNRPAYKILYVGLEKDDIAKVGLALSEAGFTYDVDSNGSTISIATGTAAQARKACRQVQAQAMSSSTISVHLG
jgi:flagellar biosynthesis/type III secretory pathway M-ring protein FliF/YscJ